MKSNLFAIYVFLRVTLIAQSVLAFDPLDKTNVINYWGQKYALVKW